ncbi:1-phosphofructokinase [Kutzneria viridogrisea]|uniref:1-phosphofructokinase family hexose kinase n=1 Tax=Kutzneria viridogrisea TaxID=47990 RepID=A0ABR6BK50_9PSEU|nr:1-phosphofructokinase family hexose kinase [Kutzneria viridogrisea]
MIVTLTPNPSLDRTVTVDRLVRGEVLRVGEAVLEPSGKGVNVARALVHNGHAALAVLPVGGAVGEQLRAMLDVPCEAVSIVDSLRVNTSVVEPDGTVTKLNEPGPRLSTEECDELAQAALRAARGADVLVLSGSLPPGVPSGFYAELVRTAEVSVVVDSSGAALSAAIPARPALVKPNLDELADLVGRRPGTIGEVVQAADQVRFAGANAVLVSLGADGALLVDESGAVHGEVRVEHVRNTVGAGDALLAGLLANGDLGEALAYAAAAVSSPGTQAPPVTEEHRAAVRLHHAVEFDRRLAR